MKFERFRAYTASEGTTSAWFDVTDDEGVTTKERRVVNRWPTEDVAFEGNSSSDGDMAEFDAGDTVVTRVVFYRGEPDAERAVGQVEVSQSGKISVACPDRVTAEA